MNGKCLQVVCFFQVFYHIVAGAISEYDSQREKNLSYNLNISEQFVTPLITCTIYYVICSMIRINWCWKKLNWFWIKSFSVRKWGVSLNSNILLMHSNSTKSSTSRIIWHCFNSSKFNNFVCFASICHSPEKKIFQAVYVWN